MERYIEVAKKYGHIDDSAVARSQARYIRAQRLDPTLCTEKFAEGERLPTGYITIAALLEQMDKPLSNGLDRLRRFAENLKCKVVDTLSGYAVTFDDAQKILAAINASTAIRPVWRAYREAQKMPATIADYQAFLRLVGSGFITKHRSHPLTLDVEFLPGSIADVTRVVQLVYDNESVDETVCYLRPNRIALQLGVAKQRAEEWFNSHSEQRVKIAGVPFAAVETITDLQAQWEHYKDIESIDWLGYRDVMDDKIYASFLRRVTAVMCNDLQDALLPALTFPQQKASKRYVDIRVLDQIEDRLREKHLVPIGAIANIANIKESHIRGLARNKVIDAQGEGTNLVLSPAQYDEIVCVASENVPVETIVNRLLEDLPTKFDEKMASWRDLLDHCNYSNWWGIWHGESQLFCAAIPHYVKKQDVQKLSNALRPWLMAYRLSDSETFALQMSLYREPYPRTVAGLEKAFPDDSMRTKPVSEMVDKLFCLLTEKGEEVDKLSKSELAGLVDGMRGECSIVASQACVEFLSANGYFAPDAVKFRSCGAPKDVSAYSVDSFTTIAGVVCSRSIWQELGLIDKAIANRTYAQLWLLVAVHVFASLRLTDYARFEAPVLTYPPDETLAMICNGTYPDEEARRICVMFESQNAFRNIKPNKTAAVSNVLPIYFSVPRDLEVEFGIILTIAIAHYELDGRQGNLIVSRVEQSKQLDFFGPVFSVACGNKAFTGRRMNKALMTLVSMAAQEELGLAPDIAYAIASALRSHKGSYARLSETTYRYVANSPMTELTHEETIKQLFRRGSCSFILDSLLRKCQGEDYTRLPVHLQTNAIVALGMSPYEATSLATEAKNAMIAAENTVAKVVSGEKDAVEAVQRILGDAATNKDRMSDCLLRALDRPCERETYQSCMGCPYEIRSKAQYVQYYAECCRQNKEVQYCKTEISRLEIELSKTFAASQAQAIGEKISVLKGNQAKAMYLRDKVLLPCLGEIAVHIQSLPNDGQVSYNRIKNSLGKAR